MIPIKEYITYITESLSDQGICAKKTDNKAKALIDHIALDSCFAILVDTKIGVILNIC